MLKNTWQFHLSNWQDMGLMWAISFVYSELLVWAFPQSHRLNLSYYLKSSLLLAFCFLLACVVDQTQMCPSSISPLGIFQGIICNIGRFKRKEEGRVLESWITGGTYRRGGLIWKGELQNPLYTITMV